VLWFHDAVGIKSSSSHQEQIKALVLHKSTFSIILSKIEARPPFFGAAEGFTML
jgi:hypothetical protein